jgi:predicted negative regulator of RcsB-dependent stress response
MADELTNIKGVDTIKKFYDENQKTINYVLIGFIALIAAIWYYQKFYKPAKEKEAYGQLFMAEKYFRSDSTRLALEGDGNYPGTIEIANNYSSTKAGNLAKYYSGRLLMTQGKFDEADNYLSKVKFYDDIMPIMVFNLRGDCAMELGDFKKATSLYKKALKKSDDDATRPYTLKKCAMGNEAIKNYSDAISNWKELRNNYVGTEEAADAEKEIARLQAIKFNSK